MSSTQEYLASKGVTMEQAVGFIMANANNPQLIYSVALGNGVTTAMLVDIVQQAIPNIDASMVKNYFTSHSIDPAPLDAAQIDVPLRTTPYVLGTSGWTATNMDAGSGAFNFVIDLAVAQTTANYGGKTTKSGEVNIYNFGADDTIHFTNSGGVNIIINDTQNTTYLTVRESALLGALNIEYVTLIGVSANVTPYYGGQEMVSVFNQLPVGDLYIS